MILTYPISYRNDLATPSTTKYKTYTIETVINVKRKALKAFILKNHNVTLTSYWFLRPHVAMVIKNLNNLPYKGKGIVE